MMLHKKQKMHQLLEKTIAINHKIMCLAESGQWEEILTLSNEREHYLKQYFETIPLPDDSSIISQVIADITQSDLKISKLISDKKSELINQSLSLKKSHNAIQRYQLTQNHHTQTG